MKKTLSKVAIACACCFPLTILANTQIQGIGGTVDGTTARLMVRGAMGSDNQCGLAINYGDGTKQEFAIDRNNGMLPREFVKTYANPGTYHVTVEGERVNNYAACSGMAKANVTVGQRATALNETTTRMATTTAYTTRDVPIRTTTAYSNDMDEPMVRTTTNRATPVHTSTKATKTTHTKSARKASQTERTTRYTEKPDVEPRSTVTVTSTPVATMPAARTSRYTTTGPVNTMATQTTTVVTPNVYPSGDVPDNLCPPNWSMFNENARTGAFSCQRTPKAVPDDDPNDLRCRSGLVFYRDGNDELGCQLPR